MRTVPLTNSKKLALVDDCQYEKALEKKWYLHRGSGYVRSTSQPHVKLNYFLFGDPGKGLMWDHENRDKLDNQKHNLRPANSKQNVHNRGVQRTNSSGFIGVHFKNSWIAQIKVNGRKIWLEGFRTAVEAARIYDEIAFRHRGRFAVLNFPVQRFPRTV